MDEWILLQFANETRRKISKQEAISSIAVTANFLHTVLSDNATYRATGSGIYFMLMDSGTEISSLVGTGSGLIPSHQYTSELMLKSENKIKLLASTCNTILNEFNSGFTKKTRGARFPYSIVKHTPNIYAIEMAYRYEFGTCPKCFGHYTTGGMHAHTGSLRCMQTEMCLDVNANGYSIVTDNRVLSAVRKSGIEYEVRPAALDMWIPKWVTDAIKMFDANPISGMSLHEYLNSIKPDKNEK